nr:MAG TPA: hypothetical protein [Caudoviricetes sp.]
MDRKPADDRCPSLSTRGAGSAITTPRPNRAPPRFTPGGIFRDGF